MLAHHIAVDIPVCFADEDALAAVGRLAHNRLPGLAILDPQTYRLTVVGATDLLTLALPSYLHESPTLARVCDEEQAHRMVDGLVGQSLGDLLRVSRLEPVEILADATLVEVAWVLTRLRRTIALVRGAGPRHGGRVPVVTVDAVLAALFPRVAAGSGALARRR